jgi:two-component system, NarL family, nitrate/nitrite response regulator NarL
MTGLRVALVEDHDLFADTLALALRVHGHDVTRIEVPDNIRSVDSLIAPLLAHAPDVVLMDLDLGLAGTTARIVEPLTRARIAVVVVTGSTDRAQWGECLHRGARRVVPKVAALQDVISTLRRIEMGVPVIARERRQALIDVWHREESARRSARERLARLSNREREILRHLVAGRQVKEIAAADVVSPATVRSQIKSILCKLEVGSQIAAVGMVHRVRWGVEDAVAAEAV